MPKQAPTYVHRNVKSNVPESLQTILEQNFGGKADDATLDSSLAMDFGADSLDLVEFAMDCEREYGVKLSESDEEVIEAATVGQVIELLRKRGAKL